MKWPSISTHDGRRAYAFLAILGGCMVFTLFAGVGLYLLRDSPGFTFWLALAAHGQILVGMTAMGWAMGRRASISVTREGATLNDSESLEVEMKE